MKSHEDVTLNDLTTQPFAELCDVLTPTDLFLLSGLLDNDDAIRKAQRTALDAIITRKFADRAKAQYVTDRKDTGTVHVPASNTLSLTVNVAKTVKWDQDILRATLASMKPADARHYGKVEIKVEEKKYSAAPPDVQAKLGRARTVIPGKMSFTFVDLTEQQEAA